MGRSQPHPSCMRGDVTTLAWGARRWQQRLAGARAAVHRGGPATWAPCGHLLIWPHAALLPHWRPARLRPPSRTRLQHPACKRALPDYHFCQSWAGQQVVRCIIMAGSSTFHSVVWVCGRACMHMCAHLRDEKGRCLMNGQTHKSRHKCRTACTRDDVLRNP